MKVKEPKHLIVLKLLNVFSCIIFWVGVIVVLLLEDSIRASFEENYHILIWLIFLLFVPAFIFFGTVTYAFSADIEIMRIKKDLYIQKETRKLDEEYLNREAEIRYNSRKKRAKAIHSGLKTEKCPNCGDVIDGNEAFCNNCGTNFYKECPKCKINYNYEDVYCRVCGKKLK